MILKKKKIWLKKVTEKILIQLLEKVHKYKTMLSYFLKFRKNAKKYKPKSSKTSNVKS